MSSNKNIVIVGSGLGGYMLAKEIRKLDDAVPLTIITANRGDFYSKPLLSNSLAQNKAPDQLIMSTALQMAESLNATVLTETEVTHIDCEHQLVVSEHAEVPYGQLVLALGAEKKHVPLNGDALEDVQSVNHLEEYAAFRHWLQNKKQIAILGAGLVGCEFANDLLNTNHHVEIVSPDPYPLMRLVPEPIGRALQEAFAEQGVQWHLCRTAENVNHHEHAYQVQLSDMTTLSADGVFAAVGLHASLNLARKIGLKTHRGIITNEFLQTSDAHIYALGDCAEVQDQVKQYVAPLLLCSRALAKTLLGEKTPVNYPAMPIVIKTPLCPIATIPPAMGVAGDWTVEGEGKHLKALFHNKQGELKGFSVSGDRVKERLVLSKEVK